MAHPIRHAVVDRAIKQTDHVSNMAYHQHVCLDDPFCRGSDNKIIDVTINYLVHWVANWTCAFDDKRYVWRVQGGNCYVRHGEPNSRTEQEAVISDTNTTTNPISIEPQCLQNLAYSHGRVDVAAGCNRNR